MYEIKLHIFFFRFLWIYNTIPYCQDLTSKSLINISTWNIFYRFIIYKSYIHLRTRKFWISYFFFQRWPSTGNLIIKTFKHIPIYEQYLQTLFLLIFIWLDRYNFIQYILWWNMNERILMKQNVSILYYIQKIYIHLNLCTLDLNKFTKVEKIHN